MATIQNDRDILLQAATIRVVPVPIDPALIPGLVDTIAATKGIKITAPSNVFQISTGGVATPSSILLTATLTIVTGTVSWSVTSGTATLTGTGNTRTLTAANMTSNSVTVRASVTSGGVTYSDFWTIAKTADGTNGSNGTDGKRGSITAFGTLSNLVAYPSRASGRARWAAGSATEPNAAIADTAAINVIWQRLGNSGSAPSTTHMRIGDTVTLTNSGQTVSATGYWTGAAWDTPGTVIDGNLLVGGNVSGQEFTGGTFTGGKFRTSVTGNRVEISSPSTGADSIQLYESSGLHSYISADQFSGNVLTSKSYANPTLTVRQFGGGGSGPGGTAASGIEVTSQGEGVTVYSRKTPLSLAADVSVSYSAIMRLIPQNGFPPSAAFGDITMHSTHGLCGYNGTTWVKFVTTAI